jgi:DNA-binding CsgD family transcriptional regulator
MRTSREWETVDAVLAAALGIACLLEIWSPALVPGVGAVTGDRVVLTVTSLVATLPLAGRRRFPLAVLCLVVGALAVQQLLTTPTEGLVLLFAAMVAAYSASAHGSLRSALLGGGVIVAGAVLTGENLGDWTFLALVWGGAWLVGFVVMQRSTDLRRAHEDNRALSARLAAAAEQLEAAERQPAADSSGREIAGLTAREVDVVREIARGKSNADIAGELYISEWTVKTHVGNILRKLGLRDRAQVVVAAYESGLVRARTDEERR